MSVTVTSVATQVSPSSRFEVFTTTGIQFRSADFLIQMMVETATMRGVSPQLTVAPDRTILAVGLPSGAPAAAPDGTSSVGDIAYTPPDAGVMVGGDVTVYRTADRVIVGVLATAKACGMLARIDPNAGDLERIGRIEVGDDPAVPAPSPGIEADDCIDFLATDIDANGQTFLSVSAFGMDRGVTYDPTVQTLCQRALAGGLTVGGDLNGPFTVSRRGFCG